MTIRPSHPQLCWRPKPWGLGHNWESLLSGTGLCPWPAMEKRRGLGRTQGEWLRRAENLPSLRVRRRPLATLSWGCVPGEALSH